MATNDTPPGFRTGLELLEARDADALRYCEDCEDWKPHDQDQNGAYACLGACDDQDDDQEGSA